MSSYLTFYVVPKAEGSKPLALVSYTRSSAIYRCFNETLNVAYIGIGDEPQYTELTVSKVNEVIEDMKDEIEGNKKRIAEYEKHAAGNTDIIEYIIELKEDTEILESARACAIEFVENKDINDYPVLKNIVESNQLFRG